MSIDELFKLVISMRRTPGNGSSQSVHRWLSRDKIECLTRKNVVVYVSKGNFESQVMVKLRVMNEKHSHVRCNMVSRCLFVYVCTQCN